MTTSMKTILSVPVGMKDFVDVLSEPENAWYEYQIRTPAGVAKMSELGYGSPEAALSDGLIEFLGTSMAVAQVTDAQLLDDAKRYRWLRSRELDAITQGGVFAGMTPDNVVLNGEDLDRVIDMSIHATTERLQASIT